MSKSKSKGKGMEDPFLDTDESAEEVDDENDHLFYAYARRIDDYNTSRYLLTFANAVICEQWWYRIQSKYSTQATRHGPQLFSFQGDDFLANIATDDKFKDLNTQWFYTQIGDATGTDGRAQPIIPLQDSKGRLLSSKAGGTLSGKPTFLKSVSSKGQGRHPSWLSHDSWSGERIRTLTETLENMQTIIETNNAQITQLTEVHKETEDTSRLDRLEHVLEQTMLHVQQMATAQQEAQQTNRQLLEQNAKLLRELKKHSAQQKSLVKEIAEANSNSEVLASSQTTDVDSASRAYIIHPPPKKLNMPFVGYAYEKTPPPPKLGNGGRQNRTG